MSSTSRYDVARGAPRAAIVSCPTSRGPRRLFAALAAVTAWLLCGSAWGHVAFEAPPANAELIAGSEVELRWVDVIAHQTNAYHLELRTAPDTAGVAIADNLPPSQHSLKWQVPARLCAECWLYIVQDNEDSDYVAASPISIVAGGTESPPDGGSDGREATGMHLPPTATEGGCAIAPDSSAAAGPGLSWLALGVAFLLGARRSPFRLGPRAVRGNSIRAARRALIQHAIETRGGLP